MQYRCPKCQSLKLCLLPMGTPAVALLFQKFGIFDSITVYFIVIGCH
jgi:hypothetical protein